MIHQTTYQYLYGPQMGHYPQQQQSATHMVILISRKMKLIVSQPQSLYRPCPNYFRVWTAQSFGKVKESYEYNIWREHHQVSRTRSPSVKPKCMCVSIVCSMRGLIPNKKIRSTPNDEYSYLSVIVNEDELKITMIIYLRFYIINM